MLKNEREQLNSEAKRSYILLRFGRGCLGVIKDWKKASLLIIYVIFALWFVDIEAVRELTNSLLDTGQITDKLPLLEQISIQFAKILGAIITLFLLLVRLVTPIGSKSMQGNLLRIGLVNSAGEAPLLIGKSVSKFDERITILEFISSGIPYSDWVDKRSKIESAVNVNVKEVGCGKDKRHILLSVVSAKNVLPQVINWQDSYLPKGNFALALGQSLLGVETVDLSVIPHILLGGSTGSGKSVLLKLLVYQCIKKDAIAYIADFKGGVDFPPSWDEHCQIVTQEKELLELLDCMTKELERRKVLHKNSGCANIDVYNQKTKSNLQRQIFACDEVAEILDKTGLDKTQKEVVSSIESKLATIARQGRAFGLHLILSTQRPDANILQGQIKNNINYRICGRADNVLSQIILDNTSASDNISSDARGRFITHEGTVFQGFWFDDNSAFG